MNIMTIMANPDGMEGEVPITINLDEVNFVAKRALEPWVLVMTGAQFPVQVINEQTLQDAGMIGLDTPEGTMVFLNINKVLGYFSPQLGTYVFVFNGSQLVVKATREEIETKLRIHKSGETQPMFPLIVTPSLDS